MSDTVLLIAGDQNITDKVHQSCRDLEAEFIQISDLKESRALLETRLPDLILCDFVTFEQLRKSHPQACVLLYTEPDNSEQMIDAIKHGALDYLIRPITPDVLTQHISKALRISHDINIPAVYDETSESADVDRIVGESPAMKEMYKLIGLIAPRDVNVLITGESGTGKELVARAILHHSQRKDKPYLAVNCAAIPETLLESELFGHEKGAFTGADTRRIGKFEQCDGGTLFLDEIGDIPLTTQVKLLRILQDNTFQRVGGNEQIKTNVRIIAATHQSLDQLIADRRFREDLYHRLMVASIHVPPLREREVDAVLLAHYCMARYKRRFGTDVRSISPEVLPVLLKYPWPGNVRELENAIKSALVLTRGSVLRLETLPGKIQQWLEPTPATPTKTPEQPETLANEMRETISRMVHDDSLAGNLHQAAIEMTEREIILACLQNNRGQLSATAKTLGISRTTLRKKMSQYSITVTAACNPNSRP